MHVLFCFPPPSPTPRDVSGRAYLERLGVVKGDQLLSINDMSVEGMTPKDLRTFMLSKDRPLTMAFQAFDGQARHKIEEEKSEYTESSVQSE